MDSLTVLTDVIVGMAILLKNTTVHGILLDALFDADNDHPDKVSVFNLVKEGIASGAVKPLPSTTFTHHQIEQSFRSVITFFNTLYNNHNK
jgi:fatty acid synthase